MSSSGPPPAAPMLEESKCALIMARAVASVIENPRGTDAAWFGGAVRAAATSPSCFFGAATVRAEAARTRPCRDPTPTGQRCKIVADAPIGGPPALLQRGIPDGPLNTAAASGTRAMEQCLEGRAEPRLLVEVES